MLMCKIYILTVRRMAHIPLKCYNMKTKNNKLKLTATIWKHFQK